MVADVLVLQTPPLAVDAQQVSPALASFSALNRNHLSCEPHRTRAR